MSYQLPVLREVRGNTIRVGHPDIPSTPLSYLSVASSAGVTSLTVQDNNNLAQDQYIVLGKFGVDGSEVVKVNAAVTQGTALTVTTTVYAHPVDTQVKRILWNQVEISGATTLTGAKTVIVTMDLMASREETSYVNTGTTYAVYFARFKNSTSTTYSEYSDGLAAAGYEKNTVRAVKDEALRMTNQKIGDLITEDFLDNQVINCDQEVWAERRRWSWAYAFDSIIGNTAEGNYSVALPSSIADDNSNKSILMVRIKNRPNLQYLEKREWDGRFIDIAHTTVSSAITASDTSITLTDTSDFDEDGTVQIGADSIAYTANNETTGVLSGCTGVDNDHSAADDAWQGASFGEPAGYTIKDGSLYFDTPVSNEYAGKNITLSYYQKPTFPDSDNDTLIISDWTIYSYFISWKILLRLNNGLSTPEAEQMRLIYTERKTILKNGERTGQTSKLSPRLNRLQISRGDSAFEITSPHING